MAENELLRKQAEAQANELAMLRLMKTDAEETKKFIVEMQSANEVLAKLPNEPLQYADTAITEALKAAITRSVV